MSRNRNNTDKLKRTIRNYTETFPYDSIDFILDLLASIVILDVEAYLQEEYDAAFQEGLDGWLSVGSDEVARHEAVYAVVDGKTFADRINEYALDDLETFESKVFSLIDTDGHRVRSLGTLAAGAELDNVGLKVYKTWYGVMDEHERDPHVRLEGQTVPLDGMFEIDGFKAPAPGLFGIGELDCNCRCEIRLTVTE